ncbi:hypothetical protein GCM10009869_05370 [Amnibacterium kyonggiense]
MKVSQSYSTFRVVPDQAADGFSTEVFQTVSLPSYDMADAVVIGTRAPSAMVVVAVVMARRRLMETSEVVETKP